jgi:carboxyl-terminal processing protease
MKRFDISVLQIVVAASLSWMSATAAASATSRAPCSLSPASGDMVSQSADALSMRLDAAKPIALANWDVRWWQRHRVWITLEATNRGDAAAHVLPQMLLDARADGGSMFFQVGTPLTLAPRAHAMEHLSIYVPDAAKTLGVRVLAAAPVDTVSVSLSLECSDARFDLGEVAPSARALVDEALKLYFGGFIDPLPDPRLAVETARKLVSGAQDGSDVVWALRGLMQALGDNHGFAVGAGDPLPVRRTLVTRAPEFDMRADGTAVVRLHAAATASDAEALAWATTLHEGIATLAARHPHAWIVDLRDFDGDSPWPAFAALATLLDGPSVGAFVSRHDTEPWIVDRGVARVAGGPALIDLQTPPEPTFPGPVAVLIGANTRNAGEDVTVAFQGRARTRFFGTRTAGFPILGVRVHRLSDGTTLGILETRDADRTGRVHRLPVEPDTELPPDAALDTLPQDAIDWVLDERAKASSSQ